MLENYDPYTLPTISFVGGETQDLAFHTYFYKNMKPYDLTECISNFSVVSYTNKHGAPLLTKPMTAVLNDEGNCHNILTVTLQPKETIDLYGKYIYQIQIKDIGGDIEIPKQGILYISNNINKDFVKLL